MKRLRRQSRVVVLCLLVGAAWAGGAYAEFRSVAEGVEVAAFEVAADTSAAVYPITVVRIDPAKYEIRLLSQSGTGREKPLPVAGWCEEYGLIGAVNAGMFHQNYTTHVGYMGCGDEVNSSHVNHYKSAAAFDPVHDSLPPFWIFDLDVDSMAAIREDYRCVVQNLRLIKRPGENRWSQQERRWSEVALGQDSTGKMLWIFSREPYSMYDLNHILLELPIGLIAAQHLEGGPEAQLHLHTADTVISEVGSFETGFDQSEDNLFRWPVPNVIGIVPREGDE